MKTLCIKVDVDTYKGMKTGVPNLAAVLKDQGMKATFFVSMGPDNSGKAVRRVFTKKGFLKKMLRTRAVSVYGFPTVLYGTLLPAPQIGKENKDVFDLLSSAGHEVGVHGYDHVKWHDHLGRMTKDEVRAELRGAFDMFEKITGAAPASFAAPGWSWTQAAQELMEENGIVYTSSTRGDYPYFPVYGDRRSSVLEIPTTLPTLDEVLGRGPSSEDELIKFYIQAISHQDISVLTVHAELEGMSFAKWFSSLLKVLRHDAINVQTMGELAGMLLLNRKSIPDCEIVDGTVDGRAGLVATQVLPFKKK